MLTELDEQFGNRTVILALRQDQQPLPDREGPFRVVVAGEVHHARWIRQVTRLRLVRIGRQASSPPAAADTARVDTTFTPGSGVQEDPHSCGFIRSSARWR